MGFAVNNKRYVACGYNDNYLRDCRAFTPGSNPGDPGAWLHKASVGGSKRAAANASTLVMDNAFEFLPDANKSDND